MKRQKNFVLFINLNPIQIGFTSYAIKIDEEEKEEYVILFQAKYILLLFQSKNDSFLNYI